MLPVVRKGGRRAVAGIGTAAPVIVVLALALPAGVGSVLLLVLLGRSGIRCILVWEMGDGGRMCLMSGGRRGSNEAREAGTRPTKHCPVASSARSVVVHKAFRCLKVVWCVYKTRRGPSPSPTFFAVAGWPLEVRGGQFAP